MQRLPSGAEDDILVNDSHVNSVFELLFLSVTVPPWSESQDSLSCWRKGRTARGDSGAFHEAGPASKIKQQEDALSITPTI